MNNIQDYELKVFKHLLHKTNGNYEHKHFHSRNVGQEQWQGMGWINKSAAVLLSSLHAIKHLINMST